MQDSTLFIFKNIQYYFILLQYYIYYAHIISDTIKTTNRHNKVSFEKFNLKEV